MKKQLSVLAISIMVSIACQTSAQDIHFSQFNFTPIFNNPAMAGSEGGHRAILNYRNQWKSVSAPYRTGMVTYDGLLGKGFTSETGKLAVGVGVFSDKAGQSEMSTMQASGSVAYRLNVGEQSSLSAGLQASFVSRSLNGSKLTWGNQFDGYTYNSGISSGEQISNEKVSFADFGAGISYSHAKGERYMSGNDQMGYNVGVSYFHPHQPDYSFLGSGERLASKFVFHGDLEMGIPNTNMNVLPSFVIYSQGPQNEVNIGTAFRYILESKSNYTGFEKGKAVGLGIHYRLGDSFIPSVMAEMGPYTLGISYDINLSDLEAATSKRGGMEVAIRYVAQPKRKSSGSRRF